MPQLQLGCQFVLLLMLIFNIILQSEIEKVKKRREERAIEKAQHEEEMVCLDGLFMY